MNQRSLARKPEVSSEFLMKRMTEVRAEIRDGVELDHRDKFIRRIVELLITRARVRESTDARTANDRDLPRRPA